MASRVEDLTIGTIVLERPCEECGGRGGTDADLSGSRYTCSACDGTGAVLTDVGEKVFAFVEHTIRRMRFRAEPPWPFG